MTSKEPVEKDPVPTSHKPEDSADVNQPNDDKRELDDAEVDAIRGGQNSHNPPPVSSVVTGP